MVKEQILEIIDAKIERCRDAIKECEGWSAPQAEWSRARDQLLDLRDEIEVLYM